VAKAKSLLEGCLYFTANSLARSISRIAEEEFKSTGLPPSHAFLMMVINENPGIGPKEAAEKLNLAPSTITRLIELLEKKKLAVRETEGKSVRIFPTSAGKKLQASIETAWHNLYENYSKTLGKKYGNELTKQTHEASVKLNK
jgi:MarR family transcriptional regulator, organic hydroperoxide resistance regulator